MIISIDMKKEAAAQLREYGGSPSAYCTVAPPIMVSTKPDFLDLRDPESADPDTGWNDIWELHAMPSINMPLAIEKKIYNGTREGISTKGIDLNSSTDFDGSFVDSCLCKRIFFNRPLLKPGEPWQAEDSSPRPRGLYADAATVHQGVARSVMTAALLCSGKVQLANREKKDEISDSKREKGTAGWVQAVISCPMAEVMAQPLPNNGPGGSPAIRLLFKPGASALTMKGANAGKVRSSDYYCREAEYEPDSVKNDGNCDSLWDSKAPIVAATVADGRWDGESPRGKKDDYSFQFEVGCGDFDTGSTDYEKSASDAERCINSLLSDSLAQSTDKVYGAAVGVVASASADSDEDDVRDVDNQAKAYASVVAGIGSDAVRAAVRKTFWLFNLLTLGALLGDSARLYTAGPIDARYSLFNLLVRPGYDLLCLEALKIMMDGGLMIPDPSSAMLPHKMVKASALLYAGLQPELSPTLPGANLGSQDTCVTGGTGDLLAGVSFDTRFMPTTCATHSNGYEAKPCGPMSLAHIGCRPMGCKIVGAKSWQQSKVFDLCGVPALWQGETPKPMEMPLGPMFAYQVASQSVNEEASFSAAGLPMGIVPALVKPEALACTGDILGIRDAAVTLFFEDEILEDPADWDDYLSDAFFVFFFSPGAEEGSV